MSATFTDSYQPNLSASELDATLAGIVQTQRRCEWLLCRYLADMADEQRFRLLGWYSDVYHYARERFALSVKSTRERVRIGRALRTLPRIEHAFVARQLSYSKVREVSRVATADDEHQWLALAQRLPMRELERRVAGQVGGRAGSKLSGKAVTDGPAKVRWRTPETVELNLHLPAHCWALLSRAMQAARHVTGGSLSNAEALEAVANQALAGWCQPEATSVADPRKSVVFYRCQDCGRTELRRAWRGRAGRRGGVRRADASFGGCIVGGRGAVRRCLHGAHSYGWPRRLVARPLDRGDRARRRARRLRAGRARAGEQGRGRSAGLLLTRVWRAADWRPMRRSLSGRGSPRAVGGPWGNLVKWGRGVPSSGRWRREREAHASQAPLKPPIKRSGDLTTL